MLPLKSHTLFPPRPLMMGLFVVARSLRFFEVSMCFSSISTPQVWHIHLDMQFCCPGLFLRSLSPYRHSPSAFLTCARSFPVQAVRWPASSSAFGLVAIERLKNLSNPYTISWTSSTATSLSCSSLFGSSLVFFISSELPGG